MTGIRPANCFIGMMGDSGRGRAAADGEQEDAAEASDDNEDEFEGRVLDGGEAEGEEQPEARADDDAADEDDDEAADLRAEVDGEYGEVHMRPLRSPIDPSTEEFENHCRTHIPFRNWCPVCVAARGTEDPHRTRAAGHVRPGTPTICIDYKELRKGQMGWIVVRDPEVEVHYCQCCHVQRPERHLDREQDCQRHTEHGL